jgi:hypothetical protein
MRSVPRLRSASLLLVAIFSSFTILLSQAACSIPNLESRSCSEARDSVKEFYSWYTGTDADIREKQPEIRARFVSPNFDSAATGETDPFLLSTTFPTTFKIGKCEAKDDLHVVVQVQLYWREDRKTDQKEVYADVIKTGDKWLIDRVDSR